MDARKLIGLVFAAALLVTMAAPVSAEGARVTTGEFHTLNGGSELGFDITGSAVMVRTPGRGGSTLVSVHLRGLEPDASYPAHVHNAPCSATPAGGGHYQHEIGGGVDPVNEIWPVVSANPTGNGVGKATHGHWARDDARSIVVHYPENTAIRLACAELA